MSEALTGGRYELVRKEYVHGPMAAWKAVDHVRGDTVLLLEIPRAGVPEDAALDLKAALRTALEAVHPSQIPCLGVHVTENDYLAAFQWPAGENLAGRRRRGTSAADWVRIAPLVDQLLDLAAHCERSSTPFVRSAKQLWVQPGSVHALPLWPDDVPGLAGVASSKGAGLAAPEARAGVADATASQYFVAAFAYELLTGQVPMGRITRVDRARPGTPKRTADAISKALSTRPEERFPDLATMRGRLTAATPRGARLRKRRRPAVVALLVLLLAVGGLGGAYAMGVGPFGPVAAAEEQGLAAQAPAVPVPSVSVPRRHGVHWAGSFVCEHEAGEATLTLRPNGTFRLADPHPVSGIWRADADAIALHTEAEGPPIATARNLDGTLVVLRGTETHGFVQTRGVVVARGRERLGKLLELREPRDQAVLRGGPVRVHGRVRGYEADATLVVNGREVRPDVRGNFRAEVPATSEGTVSVDVGYRRPGGFAWRVQREVRIDSRPPEIDAGASIEKSAGVWVARVKGSVRDAAEVSVTVNGRPAPVEDGRFRGEEPTDPDFRHVFEIVARDDAGNTSTMIVRSPNLRRVDEGERYVYAARAAATRGDHAEAAQLLAQARAHGIADSDLPAELMRVRAGDSQLHLRLETPRPGQRVEGPYVEVRGRVRGALVTDTVRIHGDTLELVDGRFDGEFVIEETGALSLTAELLRGDTVRASTTIDIVVSDANAEVRAWTQGRLSKAQEDLARKLRIPVGFENELGMRFVLVPPGEFQMGQNIFGKAQLRRHEKRHRVKLTKPFYVQITEVTNKQYRAWPEGEDHVPQRFRDKYELHGDNLPVVEMAPADAVKFAAWLSSKDGKRVYQLPTEAQWEYAARAGSRSTWYYWSGGREDAHRYANVSDLKAKKAYATEVGIRSGSWSKVFEVDDGFAAAAPVGSFLPNDWGLFDTIGNASELCRDGPRTYPASGTQLVVDPVGEDKGQHVVRGGSWWHGRTQLGLARRHMVPKFKGTHLIGFRLVVPVDR